MAKILHKQINKDGSETIVFPSEENSLECVVIVGVAPRVHKIFVVPNDKRSEVLQLLYEGRSIPSKYNNKPREGKKIPDKYLDKPNGETKP